MTSYLPFDATSSVWADVPPKYQEESSSPLCPILYKPEYSEAMNLYRRLISTTPLELSPRALALTEHLVRLNPSHYSIWQYRARILLSTPSPSTLIGELDFLDALAHANMKNYQVWQHRRLIVSALGDPSREFKFVQENLERDSKNYHTWAYRQWVLAHFGVEGQFPQLWEGELSYTEKLLREDVRNNSAWNHRWFCTFSRNTASEKDVSTEMGFTKAQIALAPNNASAWNYLRGLHLSAPIKTPQSQSLAFAKSLISTPLEAERDPTVDVQGKSPTQAIEWCLDCLQESTDKAAVLAEAEKALHGRSHP